jgi:rare lipoprotein A
MRSVGSFVLISTGLIGVAVLAAGCSRSTTPSRSSAEARSPSLTSSLSSPQRSIDPKLGTSPSQRLYADGRSIPKGGGNYKLGSPYRIGGLWYVPKDDPNYDRSGIASWYGADFHGRKTANGEIFDMNALTAAHPTLPIPSLVYVTNLDNGRTVLVRVNDRGPYAHSRVLDMSRRVAQVLGSEGKGLANVRVRYAGRAPLNGDDRAEVAFLVQQPWSRTAGVAPSSPLPRWGVRMGLGGEHGGRLGEIDAR